MTVFVLLLTAVDVFLEAEGTVGLAFVQLLATVGVTVIAANDDSVPRLWASVGVDAVRHAVEAKLSSNTWRVADVLAGAVYYGLLL